MTTAIRTSPRRLLRPGRTCWTVSQVDDSGLLIDGRDYFREFHRAAKAARRHLLLSGWQFDSMVRLVRGDDREDLREDTRLLPFLKTLCRRNPALRIYLLCWDYSPAYFFQREWFQDFKFNWGNGPGIRFRFDDRHPLGASHHQKFAVIDGSLGFVGSLDFCNARWDRRAHEPRCPDRLEADGRDVSGPYHEAQAYVTGSAAADLVELFEARWKLSGGKPLRLAPAQPVGIRIRPSARIGAGEVGLSRTAAQTLQPAHPPIREIRNLFVDAIAGADHSIYIENQYFGSWAVFEALRQRLLRRDLPRIEAAMIYPKAMHSMSEELSFGARQSAMFRELTRLAGSTGHRMGIYYSVSEDRDRYIHSKVMIVDDRFLTVGSANTNNRSMGLDSELHVSWEASEFSRAVQRVRWNLLVEHAGLPPRRALRELRDAASWVEVLDRWAAEERGALRRHPMSSPVEKNALVATIVAEGSPTDPERPINEELFEDLTPTVRGRLAAGIRQIRRVFGRRGRPRWVVAVNPPVALAKSPSLAWTVLGRTARRMLVPILILLGAGLAFWGLSALISRLR